MIRGVPGQQSIEEIVISNKAGTLLWASLFGSPIFRQAVLHGQRAEGLNCVSGQGVPMPCIYIYIYRGL